MSQGNARWGVGATGARGADGATGVAGPAGPPGAGASGAALFELAPVDSPIFIGRYTPGSGVMQQMSTPTAVGMLPVFSLVAKGLVPAPVTSTGRVLQDDGTWVAQSGGTPSGVTLAQQAVAGPQTIQGRTTLGTGTREDLAPGAVASLIGSRFGSGMQLLQAPTAIRGGMLRDDGQWVLPSFVPSGLAPAQLLPLSPLTVVGRFTAGSGTREELRGDQIASMIGKFAGTGLGLVPTPTGGTQARFLGDNGQWSIPLASGITNAQLSIKPPSVILGRSGSTGIVEELVGSGVATLLPLFNNIDKGLVPGSAGGTTAFLRADGAWAIPAAAGGVSGVAFNQLNDISAPRFLGRLAGSGSIQELLPVTAASMLPRFLGSGVGLVPVATGGQLGAFLRDDGTWATPAGGSATGIANNQLLPMPPFTIKGRSTLGSGVPEDLVQGQVASLLPRFLGSGAGLVPVPTGTDAASRLLGGDGTWKLPAPTGITNAQLALAPPLTIKGNSSSTATGAPADLTVQSVASLLGLVPVPSSVPAGLFLADDGTFKLPLASGISNSALGLMIAPRIKGRSTFGTGVPEDLSGAQVGSMIPWATSTAAGLVPVPTLAAATGAFLDSKGLFSAPTGLNNGQFAPMAPMTIKGRTGPTGYPLDLVPSQVATMLPLFNNVDKGLVPGSAGGTTAFLRADGAWAAPPAGGSVSGIAFNQIQDVSGTRFLGRLQGSGSIQELSPLSAASMLPRFLGSGMGLVSAPTGGGPSGLYLKDDGTWGTPNLSNEVTQASGVIDWNANPFYRVAPITGPITFTFTPPPVHRHLQLRTANGSGYRYVFPSLVRWPNGGGIPTGTDTGSGLHVFNFFWHGSGYDGMGAVGYR